MAFVLGIIPARGGSKGIPDKNITPLAGRPLIAYTIEAAKRSQSLSAFVLSTDSEKIAKVALENGLPCTALRPDDLSTDEAKTPDVLRYEIMQYEAEHGCKIDTVVLLQPTSPLRRAEDIDKAHQLFLQGGQKTLISCYEGQNVHPSIMYKKQGASLIPYDGNGALGRRQDMPGAYVRNGALYMAARDYFMETGRLVCDTPSLYEMPRSFSVNIDGPDDIALAEFYLGRLSHDA